VHRVGSLLEDWGADIEELSPLEVTLKLDGQHKDVFNGDVGIVERIDPVEQQIAVRFDERLVKYDFGELDEISLAYAITIHKSQGSEFPAVVIPLATQHYMLLQRNLIYTGITRGKRLLVLIGQKKALGIAVRNDRPQRRYSGLLSSLRSDGQGWVVS
jgi:exodeoxyribonuclease V alpha subunit